jgi:hypothetical protein
MAFAAGWLRRLDRVWLFTALALLILGVALLSLDLGRKAANRDMLDDSSTLPYVAFATKQKSPGPSCVELGTFGSIDCKLLLHSKSAYYFFLAVPKRHTGNLNLYVLLDSDISGIHVQRGLDRNGGDQ